MMEKLYDNSKKLAAIRSIVKNMENDKYTPDRLESACKRALSFTPRPSYKNIQVILSSGQDRQEEVSSEKIDNTEQYGFTRGSSYYGGVK